MEDIKYVFKCGNDNSFSCHGEHKVTIYDVLDSIFITLISRNIISQEVIDTDIDTVKFYYDDVKSFIEKLTDDMFYHFTTMQIDVEIAHMYLNK